MKFEIGKTYQHNNGQKMTIIGRLKTYTYGECLIGETDKGDLVPVGESEGHAVYWYECMRESKQKPNEDCISREELLKAIDTWDKFGCDADTKLVPYKDHYIPYIHYDDVIKCIKGMPSVQTKTEQKTEWIPVGDRLPEEEGEYLLWGKVYASEKKEYSFIGEYNSEYELFGYCQEQFDRITLSCLGSDFFEYGKVEAWMPLPPLYKAKEVKE